MRGLEVVRLVEEQRRPETRFVKWWRKDQDLVDFELVDCFLYRVKDDYIIDGFVLLDLEEMWKVLIDLDPDSLKRVKNGSDELIEWAWKDKNGAQRITRYPFTPESLIAFFNDEFFA